MLSVFMTFKMPMHQPPYNTPILRSQRKRRSHKSKWCHIKPCSDKGVLSLFIILIIASIIATYMNYSRSGLQLTNLPRKGHGSNGNLEYPIDKIEKQLDFIKDQLNRSILNISQIKDGENITNFNEFKERKDIQWYNTAQVYPLSELSHNVILTKPVAALIININILTNPK